MSLIERPCGCEEMVCGEGRCCGGESVQREDALWQKPLIAAQFMAADRERALSAEWLDSLGDWEAADCFSNMAFEFSHITSQYIEHVAYYECDDGGRYILSRCAELAERLREFISSTESLPLLKLARVLYAGCLTIQEVLTERLEQGK